MNKMQMLVMMLVLNVAAIALHAHNTDSFQRLAYCPVCDSDECTCGEKSGDICEICGKNDCECVPEE